MARREKIKPEDGREVTQIKLNPNRKFSFRKSVSINQQNNNKKAIVRITIVTVKVCGYEGGREKNVGNVIVHSTAVLLTMLERINILFALRQEK